MYTKQLLSLSLVLHSSAMSTPLLPRRSYYRRPLPDTCVALNSKEGKQQFESALRNKGLKSFFALMEQFTTQAEPAFCGISSLVMVLNALAVDPRRLWKGPWRWYHEELLNCCVDLDDIRKTGITLHVFACLAWCQGLLVEKNFAEEHTLEDFRDAVEAACIERKDGEDDTFPILVVSYDRKVLGQTGSGHFSPISAFDRESDHILVMDTARFKYGAHWVPIPLLFEAMKPIDSDSGKSRGYILLSYELDELSPIMPMSILLRSKKAQNPVRREYKHFLSSMDAEEITFDQVVSFWTRNGKLPAFVWEIMEPQLSPTEAEIAESIEAVRALGRSLMPSGFLSEPESCVCRPNGNRTISLVPEEAIFIVYLASLPPVRRKDIIWSSTTDVPEIARHQLLIEVDLVRHAIDVSDEFEEDAERLKKEKFQQNMCCGRS